MRRASVAFSRAGAAVSGDVATSFDSRKEISNACQVLSTLPHIFPRTRNPGAWTDPVDPLLPYVRPNTWRNSRGFCRKSP